MAQISDESRNENETYQLSIWKIKLSQNVPKFNILKNHDFNKHLFINNWVAQVLIETVAKVPVGGMTQVNSWGILHKLKPSTAKIHPFSSILKTLEGQLFAALPLKNRTCPVGILHFPRIITALKVSKYGVFSGPYFPAFGLNKERYGVNQY